ncbi:LemA family protein [Nostoc sp. 2RC]|jgi:LemA protein|uniref:LemA family protein n=1 Tax=Nostoc sp. 2RC TaxID=2485484 RepID=UPI001626F6F1|nr:LemA family protein [Nostoc sp. 2RC]MBC1239258.1 LemA family protein [Nostoc sp. 2RC]MBL1203354.1 LemA family protein [Nostoc sp. GBBB01]MDZ8012830.1 LemA family protein [Nostoc sp. ZfuVER08]
MTIGVFIFAVALVAIVALILINSYNDLVKYRNRYKNAYSQIDVQLQRRYDLIPNLVETAKGYMKHERETLEAVIAARNSAINANSRAGQNPGDPQAMQQLGNAEAALAGALSRFMVLSESYPELKADRSMSQVMEELSSTENRIAFARQAFNDAVTLYNTKSESFPSNLVANTFNFTLAELLKEANPEVRNAPRVSF